MSAEQTPEPGISTAAEYLGLARHEYGPEPEQLAHIAKEIRHVIRPEVVPEWMRRPVPGFDGVRPLDLVLEGRYEEITHLMRSLDQGYS